MAQVPADPLRGPAPTEIPLGKAPLVRVLCQIRFTEVLAISLQEFVAKFHEDIRQDYPLTNREERLTVAIAPDGTPHPRPEAIWRFFSADNNWRVSLGTGFVAMDTKAYVSRSDFLAKLEKVADVVHRQIKPAFVTRMGVRYVDQIKGPEFGRLASLLRREIVGIKTSLPGNALEHSMCQSVYRVDEGHLFARWGQIQAQTTHDPEMLPPISEPSWMLDLDAFCESVPGTRPFETKAITELTAALAARVYTVFRWAVTDDFLKAYGGDT